MKNTFLPLAARVFTTYAAVALLTSSGLAQAPAPAAPAAPGAPAAPAAPAATPAPKPLSASEKGFIKSAGKSIYFQVQLCAAAKPNFTDEKLSRSLGIMAKDLNKAWEALNKIAKERGETLVGELQGADKSAVERLGKLKDDRFEKAWLDEMTKESKRLDRDFEMGAKSIMDPDLKTYASNYTAIIRNVYTTTEGLEKAQKSKKGKK